MTIFLAGLLLGVVGGAHCIGMCGPLLLSIAPRLGTPARTTPLAPLLLYHAGRVATYTLLAIPAGLVGRLLWVQGLGRVVAIAAAVGLIASAIGASRMGAFAGMERLASSAAGRACAAAVRWRRRRPALGAVAAGAANGLLPCGMVYAAIAVAAGSGTLADAVRTMIGFGVGTMPALLAVSMSAAALPLTVRARLRRLTPAVLLLAAALLLVRAFAVPGSEPHAHAVAAHDR